VRRIQILLTLALCVGTTTAYQAAQGRGKAADKNEKDTRTVHVFSKNEIVIIKEWFSNPSNLKGLPPGLAKKDHLPPGLQRQLVRNGKLPPGLQKKIQPLPHQLEVRLPRIPDGRRRVVIAGNVILLEETTAAILDVIEAVF
jgi:hypothetical protein